MRVNFLTVLLTDFRVTFRALFRLGFGSLFGLISTSIQAWRLSIKSPGRERRDMTGGSPTNTFRSDGLNSTQSRLLSREKSRDSTSRHSSHSQNGRQTPEDPLRPGAPPRQPKPVGAKAIAALEKKKLLVLCDLPKRGDSRPGYHMLSTEKYQGEMQAMWNQKQRKKEKDRAARKKAAQQAAEARGERPVSASRIRPASAEPDTYKLRVQLPEHLGFPALSREFAFELRVTDVTAAGKPSHTWPLLTLGPERYLLFPGEISDDRYDRAACDLLLATCCLLLAVCCLLLDSVSLRLSDTLLLCDRTVLSPATTLPWIPEAVRQAEASTRPGPKGGAVVARQLSEHGLRVEIWPWKYLPEDGRTGEEAVLVSMKKAVDICVYYTLGREAKVRRLAYKDQIWESSPPPPGAQVRLLLSSCCLLLAACCLPLSNTQLVNSLICNHLLGRSSIRASSPPPILCSPAALARPQC